MLTAKKFHLSFKKSAVKCEILSNLQYTVNIYARYTHNNKSYMNTRIMMQIVIYMIFAFKKCYFKECGLYFLRVQTFYEGNKNV